jgi:Family of unknown function (DUF6262)
MTGPARTAAALRGRQADSARRRDRVLKAITAAAEAGQEISASSIARTARVDRTFLYRHRDLIEQIHATQAQPPAAAGTRPAVSHASLQADLLNAQQRAARLAARVQQLERRLSDLLGEHAWRESGLGAPADIDTLKQQNHTLEQHTVDLRLQLQERDQDPAAARTANRELMAQLNATTRRR